MSSQSRKQRRSYERILKKMDPASYKLFKKESQARGKEIHRQNVEDQLRRDEESNNPASETIETADPINPVNMLDHLTEIVDINETK